MSALLLPPALAGLLPLMGILTVPGRMLLLLERADGEAHPALLGIDLDDAGQHLLLLLQDVSRLLHAPGAQLGDVDEGLDPLLDLDKGAEVRQANHLDRDVGTLGIALIDVLPGIVQLLVAQADAALLGVHVQDQDPDLLPLADLLKGEVRAVAAHLGVPERIIRKAPTAGFWAGQTDEGEMGLTYDDLDRYLATGDAEPEVRERIEARRRNSEHKRRPVPVCVPEI